MELVTFKSEVEILKAQTEAQKPSTTNFMITGYGFADYADAENSESSFNAGLILSFCGGFGRICYLKVNRSLSWKIQTQKWD